MKIDYVARKVTLNDQVRQLTEKKLGKIRKYFNHILDIRVELAQERHLYVADLRLVSGGRRREDPARRAAGETL